MKIREFESHDLKKDQRIKVYCYHNGKQEVFAKGIILNIKKRKYKRLFEKLGEKEFYNLTIKTDEYDFKNDYGEAEIGSWAIADIFLIN